MYKNKTFSTSILISSIDSIKYKVITNFKVY